MKKWTFLVASAMLVGATPVFTGCIDNDEPEGITALRGAKSELLRAKVAVEEANALSIKADASLKAAQAKVQEALAANELAKVKITEALAKQEEAKAELINTKNEQKKAELEEYIKECERTQKEWQAEMDKNATEAEQAVKEWELAYKTAQVAYEKALVDLATAKATLTAAQNMTLEPLITIVKERKDAYDVKAENVRKMQARVLLLSKEVEEHEANKDYYTRELQWNLNTANLNLESSKTELETYKKALEDSKVMKPSDLAVRYETLSDELKKANIALADAKLAAADKRNEMQSQIDALEEAKANTQEMLKERITIPAFVYEFPNIGIPTIQGTKEINQELTYSLQEPMVYEHVNELYNEYIYLFKKLFCDSNKEAWTKEGIAMLTAELEEAQKETESVQELWQEAANAYQSGEGTADLSKYTGYAELNTAIEAYNKDAETYNKAWAAYNEAFDKVDMDAAYKRYQEIVDAAAETQNLANETAKTEYETTIADYTHELENLLADKKLKKAVYQKAVNEAAADPTDEALQKAVETAKKAYDDATKAVEDKQNKWPEVLQKAEETQATKNTAASDAYNIAEAKAYKEYKATFTDKTLAANLETARKNLETAKEVVVESLQTVYEAYNTYNYHAYFSAIQNFYLIRRAKLSLNYDKEAIALDIEAVAAIDKNVIGRKVIRLSNKLYGDLEDYNEVPRLVALSKDDIKRIVAEEYPDVEPWFLYEYYDDFGLVGQEMYMESVLALAQAYLESPDVVTKVTALFEEKLAALDKVNVDAHDAYNNAVDAIVKTESDIKEALRPSLEEIIKKENAIQPITMMLQAVGNAMGDHNLSGDQIYTQAMVDNLVKLNEQMVKICEKKVYEAETLVMTRTKQLEEWNKGDLRMMDIAKLLLEEAEAQAATAKENLDIAQAALEDAIARMSIEKTEEE